MPTLATTTFGNLLKQLRKRAGMTQGDLAAAVGYSVSLICALEQNRRQPDVTAVVQRFVPALSLQEEPHFATRLVELAAAARGEHAPIVVTRTREMQIVVTDEVAEPAHLPAPPTELLGRAAQVKLLCNRLQGHSGRLLTLIGPPGIGKTRLGLAIAARQQSSYKDGAYFVALAAVSDPALLANALVTALGISDTSQKPAKAKVIEFLRRKELLLLLDNFEQITAAAGFVAELLAECAQVCVLVTSRERLYLRAEQRYKVPPLALTPAIELFVERAQAVAPDFTLTTENQPAIAAICQKLDFLPLAIELSAAHCELYTPQQLLTSLQTQLLDLLSDGAIDLPAHQRSVRLMIQHSYGALAAHEQQVFRTLGVFVGSFALAALPILR